MSERSFSESLTTAMQVVAALCLAGIVGVILHKASGDIRTLAEQYSGSEFWVALGRYLLRNLGGG